MKIIGSIILTCLTLCLLSQQSANDCHYSENLVNNPHFDAGNTGFTSTLGYGTNCYTGYYYVGPTMQSKCYIWPTSFVDHTTGSGNFMMIDGNDTYAPQDVWIETISVSASRTYTFSFWAKNLYSQQPFKLGFVINGVQVDTTGYIAANTWNQYITTWVASTTDTISIAIRQITAGAYRDFGIDDVFMGYCMNGITGMIDLKEPLHKFSIYPNPTSGLFFIKTDSQKVSSVSLFDVLGNCILTKTEINDNQQIDVSAQAKGIYFVEVSSGNEKVVKKISLQ